MLKKLTNNLAMKFLALVFAFVIWLVICTIQDPVITEPINATVEIVGTDSLEADKTYKLVDDNALNITFYISGPTSIVSKLSAANFNVQADIRKVNKFDVAPVEIELKNKNRYSNVEILSHSHTVTLEVEDIAQRSMLVTMDIERSESDLYYIPDDGFSASPGSISVTAAKSQINLIKDAVIYVNMAGKTAGPYKATGNIVLRNHNGDEIKDDSIAHEPTQVDYELRIYRKSEPIPFSVSITGEVAEGYAFAGVDFSVTEIVLAASEELLDVIKEVDYELDIDGRKGLQDIETLKVQDYLRELYNSEEIYVVTEDEIRALVNIEEITTKEITIPLTSVQYTKSDNKNYQLKNGDNLENIAVAISGAESVLKSLTYKDFTISLEIPEDKAGTYDDIPLKIELKEDADVEVGSATVSVTISSKQ